MKVNISTVGRFHAFNLASELENRGYLNKLITTYPKFKVSEWSIPNNKIVSKILYELFRRYGEKIKILDQYVVLSAKLHHLHILLHVQPIFLLDILHF